MKIIAFVINNKEYGVDLAQAREVIRMREFTPVPDASEFVEGVISLRGKVIPLISLRKKFGIEEKGASKSSRIIITQVDSTSAGNGANDHLTGVVVDKVTDVISVEPGDITPPDELLKKAKYFVGVAKIANRLILLIDIGKMLSGKAETSIKEVHKLVEIRRKDGRK